MKIIAPEACTRESFGNGAEWTINPAACPLIWVRDPLGSALGRVLGGPKWGETKTGWMDH